MNATPATTVGYAIDFDDVSRVFDTPKGDAIAMANFTLSIAPGEFVALVGPSGCGKTTAMNVAAGLVKPSSGTAAVGDGTPKLGNFDVGYLLARDALLPWRTALANVQLPLELRGVARDEARERAVRQLEEVGLGHATGRFPSQLSHGMRQRVAVARTLVTEPKVILFDEPFSALDAQTKLNLQSLLIALWEEHRSTVMFITHDLSEAIALADRVIVMGARPGPVLGDYRIELERPRDVLDLQGDPRYHEYHQEIWSVLRKEMSDH